MGHIIPLSLKVIQIKYVYAISPDPEKHPLLFQLTTEVLNIYRREKHNNFLNKMSTLSY